MMYQDLLQQRREALTSIIKLAFNQGYSPQSEGFAIWLLGIPLINKILNEPQFQISFTSEEIRYQGFPRMAYIGFILNSDFNRISEDLIDSFLNGVQSLKQRTGESQARLAADDMALLGLALGVKKLFELPRNLDVLEELKNFILNLIDSQKASEPWSNCLRAFAGDLLDQRGRLTVVSLPTNDYLDMLALELTLKNEEPLLFRLKQNLRTETYQELLKGILTEVINKDYDLEKASVLLKALELIISYASISLSPSVSDTARILTSVQHSLKRWPWSENATRRGTLPTRWLIDNEYDVQALLWAVLYPIYQSNLVDESYLPNWGRVQPRLDLGILSLKLIIEVKIARNTSDFSKIEGEIGEDLGLYFKDTSLFDRMIVFIYDDCDKAQPEKYDSLSNALRKRDRVEDVVFVRRPSMIPNRGLRGSQNSNIEENES